MVRRKMNTKEAFYDAEIAPKLLELAKLCQDNDLCMLSVVEWPPEEDEEWSHGRTFTTTGKQSGFLNWLNAAAQCRSGYGFNIDQFILSILKDAKNNHSSAVLQILLSGNTK